MYSIIKRILFFFDPEKVHYFSLKTLGFFFLIPGIRKLSQVYFGAQFPNTAFHIWGLEFPNRIGLAAGFDKNGEYIPEMAPLGFGFIEIGTLTPKAQEGNPKPRLFRIPKSEAIINRMGFNNGGLANAVRNLQKPRPKGIIIGGNIGKNKITPNEDAWKDYLLGWEALYPYVDYFVVNVSSPNTPNLRELQEKEPLKKILSSLKLRALSENKNKPILLKIAPDLNWTQIDDILEIIKDLKIDGIVATNTTLQREKIPLDSPYRNEAGGLSGKPLTEHSTQIIRYISQKTAGKLPIIGVGGINSPEDAWEKIQAGASLIQIYSGMIYQGPSLMRKINAFLSRKLNSINSPIIEAR